MIICEIIAFFNELNPKSPSFENKRDSFSFPDSLAFLSFLVRVQY